ncbi:MAG: hypothetical protein IPO78_03220 [Saprospiraceae bacterium]|nr:hypothetical protein [Saprospiraceae bacterium]MBK8450805.1 hypothetical protein [Saprospiraceae bacterium]MBK8485115.1 hypothetical protein [Saprospiraceae bacterium]MBK9223083.1 hypothetical protein [Saprospiraceae bacterium]MBK9720613.1 hypothetical protein [Saprospiraceae bacterium]
MKFNIGIFQFLLFGLFISCSPSLSPFTQKLYESNNWSVDELKQIQFYISDDIVLRRKVTEGQTMIQNGKIKTIDGEKIEELIFKRGTPCVYLFSPKEERFAISFEQSEPPKYLMFGPNPKYSNRYVLLGKEWNRNSGSITYQDANWYTTTESAYACLLVDLKRASSIQRNSKIVKGQRVGE